MSGPRIVSLCSGYGGLDSAISAVIGGDLAYVADIDPAASALLAHRFPGVPNLGDIKAVDWLSLGAVGLLLAGYSCQPFSQAGRRLGADDPRHVWPYVAKAIGALRPGLVILENVFGHLTLGFNVVLADLAALGYDAEWVVVTASAAGACHRRARLFILAFPAGQRPVTGLPVAVIRDGQWLQPCESLFGMLPFTGRIPPSGSMAGGRVYAAPDGPSELAAGLLKTPTAQLAVNGGSQHPDKRRAGGHGPTLADQVEHELLPTPRAADGNGNGVSASGREGSPSLAGALLPTPAARDGKERDMPGRVGGKSLPETLLPTPGATDGKGSSAAAGRPRARGPRAAGDADLPEAVALLPTPRATDGEKGGPNQRGSSGDLMLPSAVMQFLPTPQATDGNGGPRALPEKRTSRGRDHGPRLRDMAPALLPAPSVADGTGGHKSRSGDRKGEALLGGIEMLLPTPSAMDSHGARNATCTRSAAKPTTVTTAWTLSDVTWQGELPPGADASRLLPTPAAGNFNDGESWESWESRRERNLAKGINGNGQGTPLAIAVQQAAAGTDWGPYTAAIRRWEAVTGRPAPAPTVPGKTGMRLSPLLPEWMMGLPAGWITDVPGLSRNAQLKLAGNGVVPQQCVLALRILLARAGITLAREAA